MKKLLSNLNFSDKDNEVLSKLRSFDSETTFIVHLDTNLKIKLIDLNKKLEDICSFKFSTKW